MPGRMQKMGSGLTVKALLPAWHRALFSHHDLHVFTRLAFTLKKYSYLLADVGEDAIDNLNQSFADNSVKPTPRQSRYFPQSTFRPLAIAKIQTYKMNVLERSDEQTTEHRRLVGL